VKQDGRFTELGNKIAIPPGLAKSIGKLAAELESTEIGGKASAVAQNNNVGLIVAGGMTIFGLVQYAKSLADVMEKINMVKEAIAQGENVMQQQPQSDSTVSNSGSVS
jgi:hypothetical protein